MARAPIPFEFPGAFFVLRWDRDRETFVVELDDELHSSYDMGADKPTAIEELRRRGFRQDFREQAVNIAREFGIAQCIPDGERVLPIIPRTTKRDLVFEEETNHVWTPGL